MATYFGAKGGSLKSAVVFTGVKVTVRPGSRLRICERTNSAWAIAIGELRVPITTWPGCRVMPVLSRLGYYRFPFMLGSIGGNETFFKALEGAGK